MKKLIKFLLRATTPRKTAKDVWVYRVDGLLAFWTLEDEIATTIKQLRRKVSR